MATYPEIQSRCRAEVDQIFESEPECWKEATVSLETIQSELKYLERCILETLRLYPPGYFLGRDLKSPLDVNYKGNSVRIPVGWHVVFFPYFLHRKEEYYKNPDLYDPDRFLPEEIAKRHPFAYIPFSAGPRNCLGQKFAMLELKTMAAYLIRNFEIESPDKMEDVPILPCLTLMPERHYKFVFRKRSFPNKA